MLTYLPIYSFIFSFSPLVYVFRENMEKLEIKLLTWFYVFFKTIKNKK